MTTPKRPRKPADVAQFTELPTQWLIVNKNDGRIICWNQQVCMFPSRQRAREFVWYNISKHEKAAKVIPCSITPPRGGKGKRK